VTASGEVEEAALNHGRRVLVRDEGAWEDLVDGAPLEPPDLFDRLLQADFREVALVGHARIGAHHVLKTRFEGALTMVVQARWVKGSAGRWQIHDAELVRVSRERGAHP
jgi:hypothetical protein